jgi:hypothetical protein
MYNVYVYCSGKSGSRTLLNTFTQNNFSSVHVHNNDYYQNFYNNTHTVFESIDISSKKYDKIYIIDSYRTPIERKISSFFENIDTHLPNYNQLSIQEIIDVFNNQYLYTLEEYHSINEVLSHYNIPLFNNFNYEQKYNMIQKDNKIFIKLLFKDINDWSNILSKIFNKNIIMYNDNLSENKRIYNLYKQFKEKYKVPLHYIYNKLIHDVEFSIYNTSGEQEEYINKWLHLSY